MSAARNAEAKRVTSIARAINWGYMWRRLMSYVWLDLLLMVIAAAILVYGYNQTLPDSAFTAGWIPGATVHGMSLTPARGWNLTTLTYTVELARTSKTFPLAQDLVTLWPLYLVVMGWQVISVLNMLGGARRVRRTMAPLNDLALRVDELGRMQLSGGKMETLEQAIERASVDSPSVTTGDADLASIEVALNRLLRQMQEAKLQQMRFVNDASHELRTPIAVIQGYVNMLDRWGERRPGCAGGIYRVPQGRKRAHAGARGTAAVFGTRRCRTHGPAAYAYQPGRTGRRGMRGIADDRCRAHVSAGL